jgi:hypothetical protein
VPAGAFADLLKAVAGEHSVITTSKEREIRQRYSGFDHVYFGGPMSHPAAKAVLGYKGTHFKLNRDRRLLPLRWEYGYNTDHLATKDHSCEYVAEHLLDEPNWEIFDCKKGRALTPPETNFEEGHHFLSTEYLLITKLVIAGRAALCVGGTHGIATRQFGKILYDIRKLQELQKRAAGMEQFQALFAISDIRHDHARKQSDAHSIELEQVAEI